MDYSWQFYEEGEYQSCGAKLLEIVGEMQEAFGTAVDEYRPKVYGRLGLCYYWQSKFDDAHRYTQLALEDCERTDDLDGIAIYRESLRAIRAASVGGPVAKREMRIAEAQDRSDELRYEKSNALLLDTLATMDHEDVEHRSKLYGLLGLNYFRLGDRQLGRKYTEIALQESTRDRDSDGIRIYTENLRAIVESTTPSP